MYQKGIESEDLYGVPLIKKKMVSDVIEDKNMDIKAQIDNYINNMNANKEINRNNIPE